MQRARARPRVLQYADVESKTPEQYEEETPEGGGLEEEGGMRVQRTAASPQRQRQRQRVAAAGGGGGMGGRRAVAGGGRRPRRCREPVCRNETQPWGTYVYKVLKTIHPDNGISRKGTSVINSYVTDVYMRIADLAQDLVNNSKPRRSTVRPEDIRTAVRLLFPGDLAPHGVAEGEKALKAYRKSRGSK